MSDRQLPGVRWIGGTSGAGKTTVARVLAERFGARLYSTDDYMREHAAKLDAASAPLLRRFTEMSMDERWLLRSPQEMLDTFHWYSGEGFDLIIEDLNRAEPAVLTIVEGHRVLPTLVHPLLEDTRHAVWLIPTEDFRRAAFESRGSTWDIAGKTSDPSKALENLFDREQLFGHRLRVDADRLGLHVIDVVEGTTVEHLADEVARYFGLVET
jgi:2-phosphoglycerate kinase